MGTKRIRSFDADAMRNARQAKGWSRGRLAVELGISGTSIAKWERGLSTPEPPRLLDIADALDIKPKSLLLTPPKEWTLADFRVVSGLHQADVFQGYGFPQVRLSSLEMGYETPRPDELETLATAYGATAAKLKAAWGRTREHLLSS